MFDYLDHSQVKELHVHEDAATGLKAYIAIHNTDLGPALGGCRFIHYDCEAHAIQDAIGLARGMSYKAALAGVPQGGGKAVIMKPEGQFNREALFRSFGEFVESLKGHYITAIDSGTTSKEMDLIKQMTHHVTSTSEAGNPSLSTAKGVFEGIKAAVKYRMRRDSLSGVKVAIQGVGNVGALLGRMLDKAGAYVIVSDINDASIDYALTHFASDVVSPDEIHRFPCSVFAPCGLSNVIDDSTIEELRCAIVAGSANVQLATPGMGKRLHDAGILYAPDYVINSGGLVYASLNHLAIQQRRSGRFVDHEDVAEHVQSKIEHIGLTLGEIFERSIRENRPTSVIADQMACDILHLPHVAAA